ncbi:toll/interleukin-1 receptor domain-containing protein [Actinoallomurus oryzae]|uniref:Toll/interleukin-1 receptor domain-containing protein n=1 Tax=Actinoallomurus oryzae TaxID=502180 RepID=A0ABP8PTC1_9ACTN
MTQCTAPVEGHRTASGAANCPACRGGRSYDRPSYPTYYSPPPRYPGGSASSSGGASGRGGSSGGGASRRTRGGTSVSYSSSEWRTVEPLARKAAEQAFAYPDRRDLFLCHAWDDRQGWAAELDGLLRSHDATVWFSERDVGLGKPLLREIDRGLASSRVGIVLVTPAMLNTLKGQGIADKELSTLLATDRVIPVAHGTTFEALREVSPMLASRSGLDTAESSLADVAAKIAAAAAALADAGV